MLQVVYAVDETVHIISGEVFVTDGSGATRRLGPGDMAFVPAGHPKRSEKACGVPPRHAASIRPRAAAWNKAVDILTGFSAGEPQPGNRPAAQTGARVASA